MPKQKKHSTLILTKKQIQKLIDFKKTIMAVEEAFKEYARKKVQMPPKIYLNLDKFNGDFRAMPAYIDKSSSCSIKWVNVHPQNQKFGLPAVMGVLILSDPRNGFPLCIMDATYLTSLRTGAAGAVAAKYLATKQSRVIGLVGCGAQAITQLQMLRTLFKIKEVRVWGHQNMLMDQYIKKMKISGEAMRKTPEIRDCVSNADIVVTITPSRKPLVKEKWLGPNTHINAIGADAQGKQELDPLILKKGTIVIDDWMQASHSGEINVPLRKGLISKRNIYAELGDIIINKKKLPKVRRKITIFDSTGLAIQDAAVAHLIYKLALQRKIGRKVSLF